MRENILRCGDTRVTVLTDRLFRIECGSFTDEATQAVWYRDFPAVEYTWRCENGRILLKTAALTLNLDPQRLENSEVEFADGSRAKLDNAENLLGTCSTLDTNGEHLREHPDVTRYDRAHIPLEPGVCAKTARRSTTIHTACCCFRTADCFRAVGRTAMSLPMGTTILPPCVHSIACVDAHRCSCAGHLATGGAAIGRIRSRNI